MVWRKVDEGLAALFPRACFLCGGPSDPMNCCSGCRRDLPWIMSACDRCGAPLPTDYRGSRCAACRLPVQTVDRYLSAMIYEYPVDRLVTLAKFHSRVDAARVLGELLSLHLVAAETAANLDTPDFIAPVPLHRKRLAERGFNQALEIALPVAAGLGLPIRSDVCRRRRNTAEQSSLTGRARYENTRDAFQVKNDLSGRHIALVDDVLTTGSTVTAIAGAMRAAGAAKIQVWSVARTRPRFS